MMGPWLSVTESESEKNSDAEVKRPRWQEWQGRARHGDAICNLQSAICNLQSAICNLQSAICNLQSAICNLRTYGPAPHSSPMFAFGAEANVRDPLQLAILHT
jgi:hypothetical protein